MSARASGWEAPSRKLKALRAWSSTYGLARGLRPRAGVSWRRAPAGGDAKPAKHQVGVDDYFSLGLLGAVAISDDGTKVAYTEGRWQESTNDRKSDIWLVATKGGTSTRLTSERANYFNLRWSPDGKFLFFAGGRKQRPLDGPEAVVERRKGQPERGQHQHEEQEAAHDIPPIRGGGPRRVQ